jgi:hypothetical protein
MAPSQPTVAPPSMNCEMNWKLNVGAGISTPPITFEVNGKKYLNI